MAQGSLREESHKLIARANENIDEMRILLESSYFFGAVNRAYYAIFHAVSALLLVDGKQFSSHKALISYFGKHYSKTGRVPTDFHRIFLDAYAIQQRADYDYDAVVSREQAQGIASNARKIVKYVENKINEY
ncbi:MAG: HEPN domain-containing protein [bacterium]